MRSDEKEEMERATRAMHKEAREIVDGRPTRYRGRKPGLWDSLTAEQKKAALDYEGPDWLPKPKEK